MDELETERLMSVKFRNLRGMVNFRVLYLHFFD
jgi:hypothetical protein